MRAWLIWGWVLGLLLLVGGCHKLLGDYTLDQATSRCASGALQCVGNVLQGCDAQGTSWDNRAVCASEALCDSAQGVCVPPTCAAAERRCAGEALQICNATRNGWDLLQPCTTAAHCRAETGTCADQPCEPGMLQCNGSLLQSCTDDQSAWLDLDTCGSSALCNKAEHKCDGPACRPGEFQCEGAQLQTCNDARNGWTAVRSCDSESLCDSNSGTCGTVACTSPGLLSCTDDGALERCAEDLTGWIPVEICEGGAAHCDAVLGMCSAEPCQPGARQCNRATLAVCRADRSGWDTLDTCQTDALCQQTLAADASACAPPACGPGDTKCVDGQPQICNAGRNGFRANGAPCATVELCNTGTGTCAAPVCDPGGTRCNLAQPEVCDPGLRGYIANGSACASAALCNPSTGTCGDQKCVAGQLRCNPNSLTDLQTCKADLTDWEPVPCDVCQTAELCSASLGAATCDATSCKEPVCSPGVPHCGGSQGELLEVCNSGLTGYAPCQTCATKELCSVSLATQPFSCTPTACTAPSCALTDRWCGGTGKNELYQCPPSRINTEATVLDTCVTSGLCDLTHSKGKNTCELPSCAPTDKWCGGTGSKTLYQCPSSRINSMADVVETCATSALCDLSRPASKTGCQAPACSPGGTQCGGTGQRTLQMCNSDQTGFTDCAACSTAALCTASLVATTCNSSACFVCATGEARCASSGNYETCRADRKGFNTTDCMGNGCDASLGGCLLPGAGGAPP